MRICKILATLWLLWLGGCLLALALLLRKLGAPLAAVQPIVTLTNRVVVRARIKTNELYGRPM